MFSNYIGLLIGEMLGENGEIEDVTFEMADGSSFVKCPYSFSSTTSEPTNGITCPTKKEISFTGESILY